MNNFQHINFILLALRVINILIQVIEPEIMMTIILILRTYKYLQKLPTFHLKYSKLEIIFLAYLKYLIRIIIYGGKWKQAMVIQ